jgi:hypothetical protein
MKKIICVLIAILIAVVIIPKNAKALTDVQVTVSPSLRQTAGEYKISFVAGADLTGGKDIVFIQFPVGTQLPCSCPHSWQLDSFLVNGYKPARVGKLSDTSQAMYLELPGGISFKKGDLINIDIKQSAAIFNPSLPGTYTLTVWTTQDLKVQSNEYQITSTQIQNLAVTVDPDVASLNSEYTITFTTGKLGNLINGQWIHIQFPEETTFPTNPNKNNITINSSVPSDINISGTTLSLKLANSLNALRDVNITLYGTFGLFNPDKGGTYSLSVWTDNEPDPVSTDITIKEKDSVSTLLQTEPISPDGTNDYYKTIPTVTLKGETNTTGTVETFYKIDNGDYAQYTQPFTMPEGTHTLYYYSKTSALQEPEETKVFKVDTTPPQINIEFPTNDPFYTGDSSILIYGTSSEPVDLIINGKATTLKNDLSFSQEISLNPGDNTITIKATDIAGNSVLKQLKVVFDTTVPVLTVLSPKNWDTISTKEITVKGTVSPSNTDVYVSGQKISVNSDGTFTYAFVPSGSGSLIPVNIKATYPFSQKTVESTVTVLYQPESLKLILTIDKNVALVNGAQKTMDVAPFIDASSSRTLVPIRFVSEFLGGTVGWDAETRTVTIDFDKQNLHIKFAIGEKTVYVNGEKKTTEVAPLIRDSRTFVPLRFVAETMGFNVDWDAASRSVTITGS